MSRPGIEHGTSRIGADTLPTELPRPVYGTIDRSSGANDIIQIIASHLSLNIILERKHIFVVVPRFPTRVTVRF